MDYVFGQPIDEVYKMLQYVNNLGYRGFSDFLEDYQHPKEAAARVALYRARLERIKQLTELEI